MAKSDKPGEVRLRVLTSTPKDDTPSTIENMAEIGQVVDALPENVPGSQTQLSFDVYTDELAVTRSSMQVKLPATIKLDGQFQHGDEVVLVVKGTVRGVNFKTLTDRYDNELGIERIHTVGNVTWDIGRGHSGKRQSPDETPDDAG